MSTTFYDSRKNTMKRDTSSDTLVGAAPRDSAYGGYLYVTNYVVPHGLGYPPQYRYSYEPFGDGAIHQPLVSRLGQYAVNPLTGAKGPGIIAWVDETNLYIQLFYEDNTLTGTYPIYYQIYKDFRLE